MSAPGNGAADTPAQPPESAVLPPTNTGSLPQSQSTQVIKRPKPLSQRDPFAIAKAVAGSHYFPDTDTVEKAVVKIIAGETIGLDPITAVQGITVIEGRIGYTGNLVATLIKQHPAYDYRVREKTSERCEIEFGPAPAPGRDEAGEWLPWPGAYGTSEFTIEDAQRAELVKPRSNWAKYPRAMCFNRALTEGVRTFIPDVTAGTPAYTADELIEAEVVEAQDVRASDAAAPTEPEPLPAEQVEQLVKGFEIAGGELGGVTPLDGLNLLLGSLGIDAFDPSEDLAAQFARLAPEQAEAIDAEFQKAVDDGGPGEDLPDAEVVEEDAQLDLAAKAGEGGEADVGA